MSGQRELHHASINSLFDVLRGGRLHLERGGPSSGCGSAAVICSFTLSLLPQPGALPSPPWAAPHAADWGVEGLLSVASLTWRLGNRFLSSRTCSRPSPHRLSLVSIHLLILLVALPDAGGIVLGKRTSTSTPTEFTASALPSARSPCAPRLPHWPRSGPPPSVYPAKAGTARVPRVTLPPARTTEPGTLRIFRPV